MIALEQEGLMDVDGKRKISRSALYDLVWSKAVTKLADEFGLSDVGFAKLCKRNNIPRPPRGYWAMLQVGKAPPKTRLPMPDQNWDIEIVSRKIDVQNVVAKEEKTSSHEEKREPIVVAETLHKAHLLVRASIPVLRVSPCDTEGVLKPVAGCLDVRVSKPRLKRALLIMDALIRNLEKCGFVVACSDEQCETRASIMGIDVPFRIDEFVTEKRRKGGEGVVSVSRGPEFILHRHRDFRTMVPSGRLTLSIDVDRCRWYSRGGLRVRWSDGAKHRIEDHLNDFIAGVVQIASVMKVKKDENDKWEREYKAKQELEAEAERRRLAKMAKIKAEQKRVDDLMEAAGCWQESKILRDYIEAVKKRAVERGEDVGPVSETGQWLTWAGQHADRLDPLKASPPSILDEADKKEDKGPPMQVGSNPYPATPYESESERRSDFFRKRWLYQQYRSNR